MRRRLWLIHVECSLSLAAAGARVALRRTLGDLWSWGKYTAFRALGIERGRPLKATLRTSKQISDVGVGQRDEYYRSDGTDNEPDEGRVAP